MINPLTVWAIFVLAVTTLCLAKPNAGRIFLGLFYVAMAIGVNIVLVLLHPQLYIELGRNALIPLYRALFLQVIALNPPLFILPVAACQIAIGLLILNKGRYVKVGLAGGIIFTLAITPLGIEELPNPVLALAQVFLLTKEFDTTFLEILRFKLRPKSL